MLPSSSDYMIARIVTLVTGWLIIWGISALIALASLRAGNWVFYGAGAYEAAKSFPEATYAPIAEATGKLIELLRFHKISFLGIDDEMWVQLVNPKTDKPRATLERPFRH